MCISITGLWVFVYICMGFFVGGIFITFKSDEKAKGEVFVSCIFAWPFFLIGKLGVWVAESWKARRA